MTSGSVGNSERYVERILTEPSVTSSPQLSSSIRQLATEHKTASGAFLAQLSKLLFQNSQFQVLQDHGLPYPIYDYLQDFASNEARGMQVPAAQRPVVPGRSWRLLGHDIGVPLGIPASVLTMNSDWIASHAENGFNVLTYKTVRSAARSPLPAPNWIFLAGDPKPLVPGGVDFAGVVRGGLSTWPDSTERFSTANSFGVPSKDPKEWQADVRRTLSLLHDDQMLLLSVMGTFEEKQDEDLVQDFVRVSLLGAETGVRVIELNLSCPNGVLDGALLRPIDRDRVMVRRIVEAVRARLDPTVSLVVKFGYLDATELRATLLPIVDVVDGVSGMNTVQLPVERESGGDEAFPGRRKAGVSGFLLRDLALDFVRNVDAIRKESGASFDIIGMGGVMNPDDARRLYDAGASAVQTASGALYNPHIARQLVEEAGDAFPNLTIVDRVTGETTREGILTSLEEASAPLTLGDLFAAVSGPPDVVRREVRRLVFEAVVSVHSVEGAAASYALH